MIREYADLRTGELEEVVKPVEMLKFRASWAKLVSPLLAARMYFEKRPDWAD